MTTDRDRVEAALREYYLDGWGEDGQNAAAWRANCRGAMSRALAAADALAPPQVLDRDAVAEAIEPDRGHAGAAYAAADRVLALLPAAPPPVPGREAERRIIENAFRIALEDGSLEEYGSPAEIETARQAALATPAPPADTGDGGRWRVGRRVPVNVYRDDVVAAQFQLPEWAAEAVSALNGHDTLTRRVGEFEEALRPFAIRMPPDRRDDDFYRPLEPFSRVGDHRRASAILGGGNV